MNFNFNGNEEKYESYIFYLFKPDINKMLVKNNWFLTNLKVLSPNQILI